MKTEIITGSLTAKQSTAAIKGAIATTGTGGRVWIAEAIRTITNTSIGIDQQLSGSIHLTGAQ